ncbi:hypothetical protein NG798_03285 [Ancylothrix sp. C2]|nr:hypothetical protein [Ancylothrix sp. D3o]MCT7948801.1 hypothetical protein [Ancylothrix sp. D3o]
MEPTCQFYQRHSIAGKALAVKKQRRQLSSDEGQFRAGVGCLKFGEH